MPSFHHGDVEIAYLDEGEGDPVVLVHGFASSKNVNWVYPTWVSELRKNGFRVIAFDNRGHGDSSKLYDPEDYHIGTMASDITALMDHLAIARADVMGYSLGARMMGILAQTRPERVRSGIFGGLGIGLIKGGGPGESVARALEAPSLDDVTDPFGRTFRVIRRSDPLRSARAGGVFARITAADDGSGSRQHRGTDADSGRHERRDRRIGAGAREHYPRRGSAGYSEPRPHARCGRQGLQGRRAEISVTPAVKPTAAIGEDIAPPRSTPRTSRSRPCAHRSGRGGRISRRR